MKRYQLPVAAVAIALLSVVPAVAQDRTISDEFSLGSGEQLAVDVKVGAVHIEAVDTGSVGAVVELECKRARRCAEIIDQVELVSSNTSRGLELRLDVPKTRRGDNLEVRVELTVPRDAALDIDVGVGQIEIAGSEESIAIDLGVGEVELELPETAVASVELDAGVGDAKLAAGGSSDHGRRGLVGKEVSWREGRGHAAVNVDVGVGDIRVRLN